MSSVNGKLTQTSTDWKRPTKEPFKKRNNFPISQKKGKKKKKLEKRK